MIINFLSGKSGAANYYVNGTKEKQRDKEKIEVLENDPYFVEKLSQGDYFKILISVEKKVSNEEMKEIYQEVKKKYICRIQRR